MRRIGQQTTNRRARKDVMLAIPLEEKKLRSWPYILSQPKIDGVRCTAYVTKQGVVLNSSTGRTINTVPHITTALLTNITDPIILDGELVSSKGFNHTISVVNRKDIDVDYNYVTFNVFDIINDSEPQHARIFNLQRLLSNKLRNTPVVPVMTNLIMNIQQIDDMEREYIDAGYEGIILRHPGALYERKRTSMMMKHKPTKQDVYTIVGVNQEIDIYGAPKCSVGSFTCVGADNKSMFTVGSGLTQQQRKEYWSCRDKMIGCAVLVSYQELTKDRKPRFPVFNSIVLKAGGV